MLAVLRVEEAACWCCLLGMSSEQWGCLPLWPVDEKTKNQGMHSGTEETRLHRRKTRNADAAKHGESPPLWNKPSVRWCVYAVSFLQTEDFDFLFNFLHTSATMRAAEWRRGAAIVLCILGYLVSRAAAKTLPEDPATEGEKCFKHLVLNNKLGSSCF